MFCLGSMVVRLKFKGIDGGLYKWWSMWFNLMQCVEFYLVLIFELFASCSGVNESSASFLMSNTNVLLASSSQTKNARLKSVLTMSS